MRHWPSAHAACARLGVKLGPPRAPNHLQHLVARVLCVARALAGGALAHAHVLQGVVFVRACF